MSRRTEWSMLAWKAANEDATELGDLVFEHRTNDRLAVDTRLGQLLVEYAPRDAEWSTWRYIGVDGTGATTLELISVDINAAWSVWLYVEIHGG